MCVHSLEPIRTRSNVVRLCQASGNVTLSKSWIHDWSWFFPWSVKQVAQSVQWKKTKHLWDYFRPSIKNRLFVFCLALWVDQKEAFLRSLKLHLSRKCECFVLKLSAHLKAFSSSPGWVSRDQFFCAGKQKNNINLFVLDDCSFLIWRSFLCFNWLFLLQYISKFKLQIGGIVTSSSS